MEASTQSDKKPDNPWLSAYANAVANIKAFSNCMALMDMNGDGDHKLLIADQTKLLKVYKASMQHEDIAIPGVPSCMTTFYHDTSRPRVPSIAVATGSCVFIYRNSHPNYKFQIPTLPVSALETKIWEAVSKGSMEIAQAVHELLEQRNSGDRLTNRSRALLAIQDAPSQAEYATRVMNMPLLERMSVTCMTSVKKSTEDKYAMSCLVIATENGNVYILDPQGKVIQTQVQIPETPVEIASFGLLDVEYRLTVITRGRCVYTIKNGELLRSLIELEAPALSLLQQDSTVILACMNRQLLSYHVRGKKNWSLSMNADIVTMQAFHLERTKTPKGLLVALQSGDIAVYNGSVKLFSFQVDCSPTGLCFGQYGREDASLFIVLKNGALLMKILKRNAKMNAQTDVIGPPKEQDIPLNIPKKTQLYVDQTERERKQAVDLHRQFQKDLCKLRLKAAQAYVKTIQDGQAPIASSNTTSILLIARIRGLGPIFHIKLCLQNVNASSVTDITVAVGYDQRLYKVSNSVISVPLLVPSVTYTFSIRVESLRESPVTEAISVHICGKESSVPLVTAIVSIPQCEIDQ